MNPTKDIVRSLFPVEAPDEALGDRFYRIEVPSENCKAIEQYFKDIDSMSNDPEKCWINDERNGLFHQHLMWIISQKFELPQKDGRYGNMTQFVNDVHIFSKEERLMLDVLYNEREARKNDFWVSCKEFVSMCTNIHPYKGFNSTDCGRFVRKIKLDSKKNNCMQYHVELQKIEELIK